MSNDHVNDASEKLNKAIILGRRILSSDIEKESLMSLLNMIEDAYDLIACEIDKYTGNQVKATERRYSYMSALGSVRTMVSIAAQTDSCVLITGSNGFCGKEIAEEIHYCSRRKDRPFCEIECVEKNSFKLNGESISSVCDIIEKADGGTVLFNKADELTPYVQDELLKFLTNGKTVAQECPAPARIDIRVIAISNIDIKEKADDGSFNKELYRILNTTFINVLPLKDRKNDIDNVADWYLRKYNNKYSKKAVLTEDIVGKMKKYNWPDNESELSKIMEYYVLTFDPDDSCVSRNILEKILRNDNFDLAKQPNTLYELRDHYEKQIILDTLARYPDHKDAAEALGVTQASFYRKINKFSIDLKSIRTMYKNGTGNK